MLEKSQCPDGIQSEARGQNTAFKIFFVGRAKYPCFKRKVQRQLSRKVEGSQQNGSISLWLTYTIPNN
ncbi:hypothetical protein NOC27_50 [Nitrosococcus oceani AFC27]|uniref:Transposase n=1 Tax=Nitrosococcus oceani C-27 TaxID=314279 RepID=A0A0E2Z0T7_9GAMM|nr:hypothetical protein NOC27_50 [Nitrosococcus oceani AFC27]KFI19218.1 hypothetical protein IB75_09675 [Nitrosococcus oceani C-27]GEM18672.1 hypothetical protein NONS58_00280 [Nitrosococcus oceani]